MEDCGSLLRSILLQGGCGVASGVAFGVGSLLYHIVAQCLVIVGRITSLALSKTTAAFVGRRPQLLGSACTSSFSFPRLQAVDTMVAIHMDIFRARLTLAARLMIGEKTCMYLGKP